MELIREFIDQYRMVLILVYGFGAISGIGTVLLVKDYLKTKKN